MTKGNQPGVAPIVAVCSLTMYFMDAGDEPRGHVRALRGSHPLRHSDDRGRADEPVER